MYKARFGTFVGFSAATIIVFVALPDLYSNLFATISLWCFSICFPLSMAGFVILEQAEDL